MFDVVVPRIQLGRLLDHCCLKLLTWLLLVINSRIEHSSVRSQETHDRRSSFEQLRNTLSEDRRSLSRVSLIASTEVVGGGLHG